MEAPVLLLKKSDPCAAMVTATGPNSQAKIVKQNKALTLRSFTKPNIATTSHIGTLLPAPEPLDAEELIP